MPPPLEQNSDNYAGYLPTDEERPAYKDVDVLLLSWEGDVRARRSVRDVQQVLKGDCGFRTLAFEIPVVENPITMLVSPLAAFSREPNQDRLLVIYYKGDGYLDSSEQLCWAPYVCPTMLSLHASIDEI